jgi:hypothetical protein
MRNRELIERLRELPDDGEVRICGDGLDEGISLVEFFRPGNAVRIWVNPQESSDPT